MKARLTEVADWWLSVNPMVRAAGYTFIVVYCLVLAQTW